MKKRISLIIFVLAVLISVLAAVVAAAEYEPANDGTYTVEFEMQNAGEYIMFVLKGEYDQTNYIEAFTAADDNDILYFEQKVSDENGVVSFGPFVPNGYFDSTIILGGTTLDEPYLAGYLSASDISNTASIDISGIEKSYTVNGLYGSDIVIPVETQVFDTFGFPSMTNQEAALSIINNKEGVSVEGNVITISKTAPEQIFTVIAKAGDATKSVYVEVKREAPMPQSLAVYTDEQYSERVSTISVYGINEVYSPITVYPVTYDQFGNVFEDKYLYNYDGKPVSATFMPESGMKLLVISGTNSSFEVAVTVVAIRLPDYKDTALELYELYNECRVVADEIVNISVDGKDVYADETWTTQAAYDVFCGALDEAGIALDLYGRDGYGDGDYVDEVTALTKARTTYENSFKAGTRKDLISVAINESDAAITTGQSLELTTTTDPRIGTTTDILTWTSSDVGVATVTAGTGGKATVKGIASGKATITVTTRAGLTDSIEVTVIKKTLSLTLTSNVSATTPVATYGGDPVILKAKDGTKGSTDVITWTVANPEILDLKYNEYIDDDGFRVIEATVIPKSAGTTKVTVSALYGEKSQYKNVKVELPDWETASAPVANVESGSVVPGTQVTLSAAEGTTIYYTLDGSAPSKTNGRIYKNPIVIGKSLTLSAIAVGENLFDSGVVTYTYNVVDSLVRVDDVSVRSGDVAKLDVEIAEFKNVKNATVVIEYNADLFEGDTDVVLSEIEGVVSVKDVQNGKITITLSKNDGFTFGGKIATISLDTKAETSEGDYDVLITSASIELVDGTVYNAATEDGVVSVNNFFVGDVNDDGKISLADVLMLKQYLAGKPGAVNSILLGAADTDGDGDVDNDDADLLSKYCVGWDVTLG
ncbi:MAG: hypothetical protein E7600_09030 [Ruminococcaceae bacterium]|nr:hypothetical protein [Oscillospiraceae bacterium]